MVVSRREAERIRGGRKTRHLLARTRKPPAPGAKVPVSIRVDNPALGYTEAGTPRQENVPVCRVIIDRTEEVRVRDLTPDDARALGYRDRDELLDEWWDLDARVWMLHLTPDPTASVRFLARRVVAGRQGDYTTVRARALPDEGEPVDELTLERLTRAARERDRERELERRRSRGLLPFDDQLAALVDEARSRHVDVRDELRAIRRWKDEGARRRQLESMRRKLEGRAA